MRLMRSGRTKTAFAGAWPGSGLESHLGPAITLGLENERLQAELFAQLEELRASRARIVETADTLNAAGSNETSTTARSSACSRSAMTCGWRGQPL